MCVFRKIPTRNVILENYPQESMNESKPTLCVPLKITSSFPINFEQIVKRVMFFWLAPSVQMRC